MTQKNDWKNKDSLANEDKQILEYKSRIVTGDEKKPIPGAELLKRLEDVYKQMSNFELEVIQLGSLNKLTNDLYSINLFSHSNLNVKLLVACCIAEVLRLNAPNPPYSKKQLKDIMWFITKLLKSFTRKTPHYNYYVSLIDSLSTVKMILLVADLNDDDLVLSLFSNAYHIVNLKPTKNCYLCVVDILKQLIYGCPCIPNEAVELVVSKFEKSIQAKEPDSLSLSKSICVAASDNMQTYLSQYFGNIILKAERLIEGDENNIEFKRVRDLHKLLLEINKHVPKSLTLTATVLREELDFDFLQLRLLAVDTLGAMFANADYNLAQVYQDAWNDWLNRRNDVSVQVRSLVVSCCAKIIINHSELLDNIEELIKDKILDPDERVRIESLKFLENIPSEILNLVNVDTLKIYGERLKDRKVAVREKAFEALSRVYSTKYNEMKLFNSDSRTFSKYLWIPGVILETLYLGDIKIKSYVEKTLIENIFLLTEPIEQKTERFIEIASQLNDRQINALINILDTQLKSAKISKLLFEMCLEYIKKDSETLKTRINAAIEHLSCVFPNPKYMSTTLSKVVEFKNKLLIQMFLDALNPDVPYDTLLNLIQNIKTQIYKNLGLRTNAFDLYSYRNFPLIINKDVISLCIKKTTTLSSHNARKKSQSQTLAIASRQLLLKLTTSIPECLSGNIKVLCDTIDDTNDFSSVKDYVYLLSRAILNIKTQDFKDTLTIKHETLLKLLTAKKCSYKTAKGIIIISGYVQDSMLLLTKIMNTIESTIRAEEVLPISYLGAINRIALCHPTMYTDSKIVSSYIDTILDQLNHLNQPTTHEYDDIEEIPGIYRYKLYALKVMGNYARGVVQNNLENKDEVLARVFTVIRSIINTDKSNSPPENCFLYFAKLYAAKSLLNLYKISHVYETKFIVSDMRDIALIVQNPIYTIRSQLIEKIFKEIMDQAIPFDFMTLLMFVAHDPDEGLKQKVVFFYEKLNSGLKNLMEEVFPLLLFIISSHPDFSQSSDYLDSCSEYIKFYLRLIENKDNIHHLYHIAKKLKILLPVHDKSTNLYVTSDLAKEIIEKDAEAQSLELLAITSNKNLPFSSKYFKLLSAPDAHNNINHTHLSSAYLKRVTSSHAPPATNSFLKKKTYPKKHSLHDTDTCNESESSSIDDTPHSTDEPLVIHKTRSTTLKNLASAPKPKGHTAISRKRSRIVRV